MNATAKPKRAPAWLRWAGICSLFFVALVAGLGWAVLALIAWPVTALRSIALSAFDALVRRMTALAEPD